ncbi:GGDEF domain-containing protein [Acidaminobacterium chupaoyuni]
MPKVKWKYARLPLWAGFYLFLFISMVLFFRSGYDNVKFDNERAAELQGSWSYETDSGDVSVTLPIKLEGAGSRTVLKGVLPKEIKDNDSICFRSSQEKVKVWVADRLIYTFGWREVHPFSKTPGSAWNMIRLPDGSGEKPIKIEFTSVYPRYNGVLQSVFYGTKSALIFYIFHKNLVAVVLSSFIFLLGILLIAVHYAIEHPYGKNYRILYLGVFSVFVGAWMLGECRVLQLFAGNMSATGALTILFMMLFPLPLVCLIEGIDGYSYSKIAKICKAILAANIVSALGFQLFGILDLIEYLYVIQMVELVVGIILLITLFLECEKKKNKAAEEFLIPVCCLLVFSVLEEFIFLLNPLENTGNFIRIGVLIFILLQAYFSIQKAAVIIRRSREASYFERLAKCDALTHCLNRRAYHETLEELKTCGFFILAIDVNDLKKINDAYGHDKGDEAIIHCARLIDQVFGEYGKSFRVGGDEFAFVGKEISPAILEQKTLEFHHLCKTTDETLEYPFHAAIGYAVFNKALDKTALDTARRADKAMYTEKTKDKSEKEG